MNSLLKYINNRGIGSNIDPIRNYQSVPNSDNITPGDIININGKPYFKGMYNLEPVGSVVDLSVKYGIKSGTPQDLTSQIQDAIDEEMEWSGGMKGGTLILPKGIIKCGTLEIPSQFVLKGKGKRATRLVPYSSNSVSSGYFIRLGKTSETFAFDCRVEDMGINMNLIDAVAITSDWAQEGTGVARVGIGGAVTTNIKMNGTDNQNFFLDDFEAWCQSSTSGVKIIDLTNVWGHVRISKPTIVGAITSTVPPDAGIYVNNNTAVSIYGAHFEGVKYGVQVVGGHNSSAYIEGCTGYGHTIEELIRIEGDAQTIVLNCGSAATQANYATINSTQRSKKIIGAVGIQLPTDNLSNRGVYLAGGQRLYTYPGNPVTYVGGADYGSMLFTNSNKSGQSVFVKESSSAVNTGWVSITPKTNSKTYDPGTIAANSVVSTTISVTDAVIGEACSVGFGGVNAGLICSAYVSAAGVVTVQVYNCTASAIVPGSATLVVKVFSNPS